MQGPRSILTKAKVCGSVLGGVAILFQGPSAGVTDPSASLGCGLGPTSDNPQAVVQVNGSRSGVIAIERSVRQGCPLSPLLYVLALEPLLRKLRDEGTSPALRGIPFAGRLAARVSAFADTLQSL